MPKKPKIFLSYAKEWRPTVESLYNQLATCGCAPWMDTKDLLPGVRWNDAIAKAIRESDIFLACITSQFSGQRRFLQRELKIAIDVLKEVPAETVYVIPIRLEPGCALPADFAAYQADDFYLPGGIQRIVRAISEHCKVPLRGPPLWYTWKGDSLTLEDFSPRLIKKVDKVLTATYSALLRYATANVPSKDGLRKTLSELRPEDEFDIEVTCLSKDGRYLAHPWGGVVGTFLARQWPQRPGFAKWALKCIQDVDTGYLIWTDRYSSDFRLELEVYLGSWNYKRKTLAAFREVRLSNDFVATAVVEGHEVVRVK